MARKSYAVGVVLVVVLAGLGGIVHADSNGPVAQTGNTPVEQPTDTPAESTATPEEAPPEEQTPAEQTPVEQTPDEETPDESETPAEPAPGDTADTSGENTTISVSASATAEAAPDTVRIRAAVVATASDAETARRQVAENVSQTRTALTESGITDDQFQTRQFDIRTVREPRPNDSRQTRYRAVNEFEIEVSPDRAGEIIDSAVGNGTNQINGVTFTLADDTRLDLRQQALRDAMSNARTDANTIASESNVTVQSVKSVSTSEMEFFPIERGAASGVAEDASTVIEPGPVEVSATVSVTYRAA
ncbi:SIMPL domain-containing protein [Salinibaculum salinum]|uniref:SIMPL domain-containing protein n=1 Tax=Salinibaculum salinum TaxID=3131996 RepID=UPI0030EB237C